MTTVLIASVGGSPAPIAGAIAAKRPDHALFLATEAHASGPGSAAEIPAILQRAQATSLSHDILLVPPDDPEAIFLALREALGTLGKNHPGARLIFDYTGGTKSMTSALFQAALATLNAELQFMAGRRENLDRVAAGTERATDIPIAWLLAERTEARLRAAWNSFAYAECARGVRALLDELGTDDKAPQATKQRLRDLGDAAAAFDAWDRFDHKSATAKLAPLAARHLSLKPFAELAARLVQDEGARLPDLMRNAERAAARGRYDDAVARLYRLIEWSVQWHLKHAFGVDTGNIDWSNRHLTDDVVAQARMTEVRQRHLADKPEKPTLSGLTQSINLASALEPDGLVATFDKGPYPDKKHRTGRARLNYVLRKRNHSILAHGENPLDKDAWDKFAAFMAHWNANVLHPLLKHAGIDCDPPQLPQTPPTGL